jgi:hypothetical protein
LAGHVNPASTSKIAVSQQKVVSALVCTFTLLCAASVASQIGSGMVRFTLCKLLSNDEVRSSGQFRKLFWKHKLIFTGLDWIAGPLVPPSKCIIASSSKSQVTMPSKPTYMHVHVSLTPCFPQKIVSNDPKQSDELG